MLTTVLFLLLGFAFLIKGADFMVEGASSLAKRWGISPLVIGLTVVAFGTSAPELIVSVLSSLNGSSDIAVGNVLGSNIANILLILGVAAIITPLGVSKGTVWKEIPLSLLAILVLGVIGNDVLIDGGTLSSVSRIDGLILLAFFIIFLYYTYGISKVQGDNAASEIKERKALISVGMVALGLLGLIFGGKWVVDSAIEIATGFGLSEQLVGLTIVAVGTSLPELVTSAVAAYKKNVDIAVGNVVGSNLFNVFFVLGTSAVINPLNFNTTLNLDIGVAVFASLLLFVFMFLGKKHHLERFQGVFFILTYVAYVAYLVMRG